MQQTLLPLLYLSQMTSFCLNAQSWTPSFSLRHCDSSTCLQGFSGCCSHSQHVKLKQYFILRSFILCPLPCSLVLGIFPQGLVAVTVAAQVASMSARFSTPVLFFLPVARSHSPHTWNSYLHSPAAQQEMRHLIKSFCYNQEENLVKRQHF